MDFLPSRELLLVNQPRSIDLIELATGKVAGAIGDFGRVLIASLTSTEHLCRSAPGCSTARRERSSGDRVEG